MIDIFNFGNLLKKNEAGMISRHKSQRVHIIKIKDPVMGFSNKHIYKTFQNLVLVSSVIDIMKLLNL